MSERDGDARTTRRLVLATRNTHKVRELAALLAPHEIDPLPDGVESPPEDANTFVGNALIKARHAHAVTGRAAVADDSGIVAEALGGRPGVRSARYAGEHASDGENLARLLREAPAGSAVAYVCALAYIGDDGHEHVVEGRCEGTLAAAPRGERGFGYDPAFVPVEHPSRTMAELTDVEKAAISHRGRAARELMRWLDQR